MMQALGSSLWLSLKIALGATIVATLIGVPLAFAMARRRFIGRTILETLITVPLVLPPTVVGYLLLLILGQQGFIGAMLDQLGIKLIFTIPAAIIASTVVALPLLYLPARAAFATVESELEDVARLMGANPLQTFWHVSLPIARRGIASGVLLAFARALGEFGATLMVFGSRQGHRTLPILVYDLAYETSDSAQAIPPIIALSLVSLLIIYLYNRSGTLWAPD